jgi:hypothetical protein
VERGAGVAFSIGMLLCGDGEGIGSVVANGRECSRRDSGVNHHVESRAVNPRGGRKTGRWLSPKLTMTQEILASFVLNDLRYPDEKSRVVLLCHRGELVIDGGTIALHLGPAG